MIRRFELRPSSRTVTYIQVGALVLILLAIFAQSYNGRRDVVAAQRRACVRGMTDRFANMEAWYAAYLSREAQARATTNPKLKAQYQESADAYLGTVTSSMQRVDAAHSLIWPYRSGRHPLGLGHFSCVKAIPAASPFQFVQ